MKNSITLKDLKKSYSGHCVLDGFCSEIVENTAVMGASGSGKTTLIRIIMGLEKADAGEVIFREKPRFAAVFQEDRLFADFGATENITAVTGRGAEREKRAAELLSELLIDSSEQGKAVRDFSGGMKRRVAIARALAAESDILVLDEPFKGLDEDTRAVTASVIREYSKDKLIILVTHDIREAELLGIERVVTIE